MVSMVVADICAVRYGRGAGSIERVSSGVMQKKLAERWYQLNVRFDDAGSCEEGEAVGSRRARL